MAFDFWDIFQSGCCGRLFSIVIQHNSPNCQTWSNIFRFTAPLPNLWWGEEPIKNKTQYNECQRYYSPSKSRPTWSNIFWFIIFNISLCVCFKVLLTGLPYRGYIFFSWNFFVQFSERYNTMHIIQCTVYIKHGKVHSVHKTW